MSAHDFLAVLDLEELDRDLYRGAAFEGHHLFGGHVLAQALRAATLTVPDDRAPHSLHGYFLRRGDPHHHVILQVHSDRDGGSFSARRVVAIQHGEVIFTVAASFATGEPAGEYQAPMPAAAPPDDDDAGLAYGGPPDYFESRSARPPSGEATRSPSRLWMRARAPLGDDPAVHACALAYVSDFGSGFGGVEIEGVAKGGPSIDHAMWFHGPIRADDWMLLDLWPLRASQGRGTYMGTIHDRNGMLGCHLAQEALLRVWREMPDGAEARPK
jgi:acyl-CoA thioesterase II